MGFEVFKDKKNEWRFRFRAKNGEIQCQSEGYTTKNGAIRGSFHLEKNIIGDESELKVV